MANDIDLGAEILSVLQDFTTDVSEELETTMSEVSKEAVNKLRKGGTFKNRTLSVKRGWKIKRDGKRYVIYNTSPHTHLLETGHVTRNGGRTKSYDFIRPVDEWVAEEVAERTQKALGG